ncbi:MAG: sugar phosphate nucleotidyltransferase [Christensenellales bacterium]|jgi:mannose-1-phosphate guanylyltransferase/phosphomannomutase
MKTVILAGGSGTRLRPMTCTLPKPMVPVMNRPLLLHTLRLLRRHGITSATITLGYLPKIVERYFGNGERVGMNLSYSVEDSPLGTAGGVLAAAGSRERVLVISGDALTDVDITAALAFHESHGGAATIILKQVEKPLQFGVAVTDETCRITRFIEKPSWSMAVSDQVNTGMYILEPSVWKGFKPGEKFDFSMNVFPRLMENGEAIFGMTTDCYWCDIGGAEQYVAAHRDIFEGKCRLDLPEAKLINGVYVEEGARISDGCTIKGPCYLGANCAIERGAVVEAFSVIGSETTVAERASIRRSILWRGVDVGVRAQIRGAVVCDRVYIGRNASVFEHAVVAEESMVCEGATIKSGVRVWPQKTIEEGATMTRDCLWSDCSPPIFKGCMVEGKRYDLTGERLARLGRAIASVAGEWGSVAIASDGTNAGHMAKLAVAAGLLEGGCDALDMGRTVLPAARNGARALSCGGSVYASRDGDSIVLRLMDGKGNDAGRGSVQDVEIAYWEGCGACQGDRIGAFIPATEITTLYRMELLKRVNSQQLRAVGGFIALTGGGMEEDLLKLLFSMCGYSTASAPNGETAAVLARRKKGTALAVKGDSLSIFLPSGELTGSDLYALFAEMDILCGERELFADVTAGPGMEKIAERSGARLFRLPRRELKKTMADKDTLTAELLRDPFGAALMLCARLSEMGMTAEDLYATLPKSCKSERNVPVSARDIGRIFRLVAQDSGGTADMTEGIRIIRRGGWVNLLPDATARHMRVIAQSFSEEYSESLADIYAKKVEKMLKDREKR